MGPAVRRLAEHLINFMFIVTHTDVEGTSSQCVHSWSRTMDLALNISQFDAISMFNISSSKWNINFDWRKIKVGWYVPIRDFTNMCENCSTIKVGSLLRGWCAVYSRLDCHVLYFL